MIKSVESFFERAKANTPACKEYSLKIMHAKSKMEIFKAALEIQSIEFLCKAIDEGWGMTSDEICADFAPYLNGNCVYDEKYTSELYCRFKGEIKAKSTVYCLIDCDCVLNLEEEWRMCKLYVVGNSRVEIKGKGTAFMEFIDQKSVITDKRGEAIFLNPKNDDVENQKKLIRYLEDKMYIQQ